MTKKDISMVRGDTLTFDVKISDIEGATIESLYFSVKANKDNASYMLQKSIGNGITMADDDTYRVRIAPEDTSSFRQQNYVYDLQIGIGSDIYTLLMGQFNVVADVTR